MNRKKTIALIILLILTGGIIYFFATHVSITQNTENDFNTYTPEQEISEEQLRKTNINLYFLDTQTNTLKSESKSIDSNELLNNPYKLIIEKLIEGPTSNNYISVIPKNTKILDASLSGNCVILNFSEELKSFDANNKYNITNSILNSLAQLNEVNSIKILINGEPLSGLDEEYCILD